MTFRVTFIQNALMHLTHLLLKCTILKNCMNTTTNNRRHSLNFGVFINETNRILRLKRDYSTVCLAKCRCVTRKSNWIFVIFKCEFTLLEHTSNYIISFTSVYEILKWSTRKFVKLSFMAHILSTRKLHQYDEHAKRLIVNFQHLLRSKNLKKSFLSCLPKWWVIFITW